MSRRRHTPEDERFFLVRSLASDLPNGRSLSAHAHPWSQLIYAVSGVLSVWTEQGSWVTPPQWAVWAPAGVAHAMRVTGATSLRTLYVRPGLPRQPRTSSVIAVSPLLRELILRAVDIGMLDRRQPTHRAMTDLILHELRAQPTPSLDLPQPRSGWVRRIADYMVASPSERGSHAALAKRFGVGVRTLERSFVEETGLSLGRWRKQARMLHALRGLGAGASVKQVALEAGYLSPSAFIAAFRSALHTTPGKYFGARRQ
jgi:AraC-like DNA-binding protein/mannose-6-phosphate isomerase-like protein (cupin superfamily)